MALQVEKNRKRFHAFDLPTRETDDAEDRFRGIALRREAAVPLLPRPPSFVPPLFASHCSRCLINVPKSKLDSTRYSTTILFANTWPSARAFNQFVGQSEMIYKF